MSLREVVLPSLGDDDDAVHGGEVSGLLAKPGDTLAEGGDLLELTTDKAAFVVPAPCAGVLREWRVSEGDEVKVQQVLCVIETEGAGAPA